MDNDISLKSVELSITNIQYMIEVYHCLSMIEVYSDT